MRDAGPDAAKVLAGLMRRRFLDIMPLVAFVTILAGLWLYWKDSSGFQASFMGSPFGIMIGLGALTGLVAFAVGLAVLRPAMLRAFALAQAAAAAAPPEREAQLAQVQALRMRAAIAGRVVAVLLALAAAAMALARYV
jgi:hypothetical protein